MSSSEDGTNPSGAAGGATATEENPPELNAPPDVSGAEGLPTGARGSEAAGVARGGEPEADEKTEKLRLTAEKLKLQVRTPRKDYLLVCFSIRELLLCFVLLCSVVFRRVLFGIGELNICCVLSLF